MNRSAATMYILWALFLIFVGYSINERISNLSDPNSLANRIKALDKVIDEDSEISR